MLLDHNVNVDVMAPKDTLLKGRTPLMYNLVINNYERSKV